ncbi:hypothetical protein CEXT_24091 [Caerostris extrusa]|uniref:Uncharacterized protein n=1 Tax=Caerostris extrusa TaxID=172846 RepID=A0AAV4SHQ2_CAEEX|nr:hypothetical protein CEXT_24091 [Caerostris extrusa]
MRQGNPAKNSQVYVENDHDKSAKYVCISNGLVGEGGTEDQRPPTKWACLIVKGSTSFGSQGWIFTSVNVIQPPH